MQYCWEHRLWRRSRPMVTSAGQTVEVIDPGLRNTDSGPDFFNAKVRFGNQIWAGNIELHINASDWYRHGHDKDMAYSTVILHVVMNDDGSKVYRTDGVEVPLLEIEISDEFMHSYTQMVDSPFASLPCSGAIIHIPRLHLTDWISALGYERLYQKSDRVLDLLRLFCGDWNEVVYVLLARGMGFGKNSEPFEMLARSTPLKYLLKHRDSLASVEAVLFGQAGFLDGMESHADPYVRELCREYKFMAAKFGLQPQSSAIWKTSGMRPQSFPYRRIAALAMMVHEGFKFGLSLFETEYADDVRQLLRVSLAPYWRRRYSLGAAESGMMQTEALSKSARDLLIINVVVPLIHARGVQLDDQRMQERAVDMLTSLDPEKNSKIEPFERSGIRCADAFTSQALLQLRRAYCDARKCLYCRIGHRLLAMSSRH